MCTEMKDNLSAASEPEPVGALVAPEPEPFDGDFRFDFYIDLLAACAKRFAIHPLGEFVPPIEVSPRLYLRHDIDVAIAPALMLAEQEAAHGFRSTYMFIPTSPLYDISERAVQAGLKRIAGLGHEVALHFDYLTSGVPDPSDAAILGARVEHQCDLLAGITGERVESISFHRPLKQFLQGPDRLWGRVNAYSATLMHYYRSDSAGCWRSGNPLDDLPRAQVVTAQLLTHPIWWGVEHLAPADRLQQFFQTKSKGRTAEQRGEFSDQLSETLPGVVRSGLRAN